MIWFVYSDWKLIGTVIASSEEGALEAVKIKFPNLDWGIVEVACRRR